MSREGKGPPSVTPRLYPEQGVNSNSHRGRQRPGTGVDVGRKVQKLCVRSKCEMPTGLPRGDVESAEDRRV